MTAIRTVAEIQKIFTYQAQNAIIVRGEADKVALAEKMIADLDKPKGEVLVDILVMEVNRAKTRNLAAAIAPSGINSPIAFTPRASIASGGTPATTTGTPATASTSIPLSNIGKIGTRDFSLTLPGGLLNALINDTNSKVLQSPQIRAVDNTKVSLKIGDKIPYATGSFQPGIGGVGINPLVNTQFTFLDVGVNVDITAKVHSSNEVSMHIVIEISNVKDRIDLGGVQEPEVGQTKIESDIRLKQGEVNLIGGLMQVQETKTISGVPGLASIPVIRRLFTSETVTKDSQELVIALIPHIVRSPDITDVNLRSISAGNSTTVKLTYAPQKGAEKQQPATPPAAIAPVAQPVPGLANSPGTPSPIAPNTPPVTAPQLPGVNAPPATAPPVPPAKPDGQAVQPPTGNARVTFVPGQASAQLNGTITVSLMVDNATDLASTPMQVRFDPKILAPE